MAQTGSKSVNTTAQNLKLIGSTLKGTTINSALKTSYQIKEPELLVKAGRIQRVRVRRQEAKTMKVCQIRNLCARAIF